MVTKCPECNKEISSKANTCPHCGFPFLMNKFRNAAKNGSTIFVDHFSSVARMFKHGCRVLGVHLIKQLVLWSIIFALAVAFRSVTYIAAADIHLRIIVDIFLPFFWLPILLVTNRLYGVKPTLILYFAAIVMMCIGILAEFCSLYQASIFNKISFDQMLHAVTAKVLGLILFGTICKPRAEPLREDHTFNEDGTYGFEPNRYRKTPDCAPAVTMQIPEIPHPSHTVVGIPCRWRRTDSGLSFLIVFLFVPLSIWGGLKSWAGVTDWFPHMMMAVGILYLLIEAVRLRSPKIGLCLGIGVMLLILGPSLLFYRREMLADVIATCVGGGVGLVLFSSAAFFKKKPPSG